MFVESLKRLFLAIKSRTKNKVTLGLKFVEYLQFQVTTLKNLEMKITH